MSPVPPGPAGRPEPGGPPAPGGPPSARILDVGYRPYDGPRRGLAHAVVALALHTAQRVLGLKRDLRHKVLPAFALFLSFAPALVFIGMAAFLPESLIQEGILPTYGEYYGFVGSALLIFAALVSPEALCTDRRTGMLGLYLASPLDRLRYLAGKAGAVGGVMSAMTIGPLALLLVAYTLEGAGPDGVGGFAALAGRILLAGTLVAAYFTSVSMAIAAATRRRAVASAAIVLVLMVSAGVTNLLIDERDMADALALANLIELPFDAAQRALSDPVESDAALSRVRGELVLGATVAWTAVAAAATWWQYRRMRVQR